MNEILKELDYLANYLEYGGKLAVEMMGVGPIEYADITKRYFDSCQKQLKAVRDKVQEYYVLYGDPAAPKPQGTIEHG